MHETPKACHIHSTPGTSRQIKEPTNKIKLIYERRQLAYSNMHFQAEALIYFIVKHIYVTSICQAQYSIHRDIATHINYQASEITLWIISTEEHK